MAEWVAFENRRANLTLNYRDVVNGTHDCGELRRDTSPTMILQWVLEQDALQPGDIIKLHDGTAFQVALAPANA